MTYCIADIHGEYEKLVRLLEEVHFSDDDTLYVIGDILDRGPHPIKTLLYLLSLPNVVLLLGNHEHMASECFPILLKEITNESLESITTEDLKLLADWMANGAESTIKEFRNLPPDGREFVMDSLLDLPFYEEVTTEEGKAFVLVHAGLPDFEIDKPLSEYDALRMLWDRPDYEADYYPDKTIIVGHTPTPLIEGNNRPGSIFHGDGIFDIDCGACFKGGRLAALCLETMEEYYEGEM